MQRLFTAICLPEGIRALLSDLQRRLQRAGLYASWIPESNLHLSLIFLGNIEESRLQDITGCIQRAAVGAETFTCTITKAGFFGPPRSPRILWAGIDAPPVLTALQNNLNSEFNRSGFQTEERPYYPHITLARIKPRHRKQEPQNLAGVLAKNPVRGEAVFQADALHLMQSILTPERVTYTSLFRQPLKGGTEP